MKTRKLTMAAMLVALGVALGNIIYIPVGMSKCFPVQHSINIIAALSLGPAYSLAIAFLISLVRNILATGSLLAFPGSMIGALMAGLAYKYSGRRSLTALAEVVGTGIIGGLVSYPVAKYFMAKEVALLFFVYPFLISSLGGSLLALVLDRLLDFENLVKNTSSRLG